MGMTDQEQKALRSYCAFILKEYGFQIPPNDPVVPALYLIHREMQLNIHENRKLASLIKDSSSKSNEKKEYHFHAPGEAWKFQIAGGIKILLIGITLLGCAFMVLWKWSLEKEIDQARMIIQGSDRINQRLLPRMQKDSDGFYFIDFKEASGKTIQSFTEFDNVGKGTVRIYLGREN